MTVRSTAKRTAVRSMLALLMCAVAACGGSSGASRTEVRSYLDTALTAAAAPAVSSWTSSQGVLPTAGMIGDEIDPNDSFTEGDVVWMRGRDYMVRVAPQGDGSVVELDAYDTMYRRHRGIVGHYWGSTVSSYGPRGDLGGDFRGGGPGAGK